MLLHNCVFSYQIQIRGGQGGGPGISCASFETPTTPFYSIFKKQISGVCLICAPFKSIFFEKFPENFLKISQLFKNRNKTIVIALKIDQNHYIYQNLAKFSLKTPKNSRFSHKNPKFFKIFGAFGAKNLEFYVPKIWSYMSKRVRLGSGSPQLIFGCYQI